MIEFDAYAPHPIYKFKTKFRSLEDLEWFTFFKGMKLKPAYRPLKFEIHNPGTERYNVPSRGAHTIVFEPTFELPKIGYVHCVSDSPTSQTANSAKRLAKEKQVDVYVICGAVTMPQPYGPVVNRVVAFHPDCSPQHDYRMLHSVRDGFRFGCTTVSNDIFSPVIQDEIVQVEMLRQSLRMKARDQASSN